VIDFTANEVRDLLDRGEQGIGLEILISNLHEASFPLGEDFLAELRWLASRIPLESYVGLLDELHGEPGAAPDRGGIT
jgi:hypothetical protein